MLEIITILCLLGAAILLVYLCAIDLREGLLPNEFVMGFAALGLVFHLSTMFRIMPLEDALLGGFIGGAFLYVIRGIANFYYKQDSLGLGDVKLLTAAGIWLGPFYILIGITLGALAGVAHGFYLLMYHKITSGSHFPMARLSLPAGPGFAVGIAIAAGVAYKSLPALLIPGLLELVGL